MRIIRCQWTVGEETHYWPLPLLTEKKSIPALMRRRLSSLGQVVISTLLETIEFIEKKPIPWVIASRNGDLVRLTSILNSLAREEIPSPTDFSLSVHNAIGALFSIHTGNQETQSALAAGLNSFEAGLLEAYALQKDKGGVVGYVLYDSLPPAPYQTIEDSQLICISMLLGDDTLTGRELAYCPTNKSAGKSVGIDSILRFLTRDDHNKKNQKTTLSVSGGVFILD